MSSQGNFASYRAGLERKGNDGADVSVLSSVKIRLLIVNKYI